MTIPGEIRKARKREKLTQAGLAAKAGINQATLSRVERGHQFLNLKDAIKLSQALGFDSPQEFGYPMGDAVYYTLGCTIEELQAMLNIPLTDPYDLFRD